MVQGGEKDLFVPPSQFLMPNTLSKVLLLFQRNKGNPFSVFLKIRIDSNLLVRQELSSY